MKILLIEDFSGVHLNLLNMLYDDQHDATLLTTGDGYKAMRYDALDLPISILHINPLRYFVQIIRHSNKSKIIQFINLYRPSIYLNLVLIFCLRCLGKEVRYYAVGTDPSFLNGGKYLRHFAWDNSSAPNYSNASRRAFWSIIDLVTIFVPNKSYAVGFEKKGIKVKKLFYPRFPPELVLKSLKKRDGLFSIFAPVSRRGFKGYNYIEQACNELIYSYPENILTVKKTTRIPFADYLRSLANCDVLIDQCLSSDYAMNAILGMESGKTVLCGVSIEHLKWAGIKDNECPVIDILPDVENIVQKCRTVLKTGRVEKGANTYLDKYHGKKIILTQFFSLNAREG